MPSLSVDLETYSSVDLKKAGMFKYVQSPDFEIMLFAWAFDDEPVQIADLKNGELIPAEVSAAIGNPSILKCAYNAAFEWYCLSKHYGLNESDRTNFLSQWRCTMMNGAYHGFPMGLAAVSEAINLPIDKRKLGTGSALIRTFCVPCKPSKANGFRTRTLSHHEPQKWELFKTYCKGDVDAERAVARKLKNFPVPHMEQYLWELDVLMNADGVRLDTDLVESALALNERAVDEFTKEAIALTGLTNPKSVQQLVKWLTEETDEKIPDLKKDTVKHLLGKLQDEKTLRVLELRQELSKTSVRKYAAMRINVGADGRGRGFLQHYGANRTGRYSGRIVQVQNLPRNYLETLDHARECAKMRKYDAIKIVYGSVPDTLSQLIRTTFIPAEGHKFAVADFSAIEARVIAWLAGEQWRQEVFATHGKIYEMSASQMFGVPLEKIKKGNPEYDLRQRGKVAELACIAEGQLVLTDSGLIPIEKITLDNLVYDGVNFVKHAGVVCRGIKEVIHYDGLWATPDHQVWIKGAQRPVRFDYAAANGAHLLCAGAGGVALWLGEDHSSRKAIQEELAMPYGTDAMLRLWGCAVAKLQQFNAGRIKGLPKLFTAKTNTPLAGQTINSRKTALRKSARQGLQKLRGAGDRVSVWLNLGSRPVGVGKLRPSEHGSERTRPDRRKRALRTGQSALGYAPHQLRKPTPERFARLEAGGLALLLQRSYSQTIGRLIPRTDHNGRAQSRRGEAKKLAWNTRKALVYDILDAGPLHRFTVSGKLVHNCGYGGGVNALTTMDTGNKLTEEEKPDIVKKWRKASPAIVKLWYDLGNAAISVVKTGQPATVRYLYLYATYDRESDLAFLVIRLPCGRELFYPKPTLTLNGWGRDELQYWGVDQDTKKWQLIKTYGGKLSENVTQAIARDCLTDSLIKLTQRGHRVVMHVHDEAVIETPADRADAVLEEALALMAEPVPWAPGLLLGGAGFVCDYYQKD